MTAPTSPHLEAARQAGAHSAASQRHASTPGSLPRTARSTGGRVAHVGFVVARHMKASRTCW
jgi:hypothetical protein